MIQSAEHILKETSNAKSELILLEWTHVCVSAFVLYNIRLVNIFSVAIYDVIIIRCVWQIWLHFMLNWMKYKTLNLILRWKFLSVYFISVFWDRLTHFEKSSTILFYDFDSWFKQYYIYQILYKYTNLQFYVFPDLAVSLELIINAISWLLF